MFWHYTSGKRIDEILKTQRLITKRPNWARRGKASVWFSTDPDWEPSASPPLRRADNGQLFPGSKETTDFLCDGLFRVAVCESVGLMPWERYLQVCGLGSAEIRRCREFAQIQGADLEKWYAALRPIDAELWGSVQRWYGESWQPLEEYDLVVPGRQRLAG